MAQVRPAWHQHQRQHQRGTVPSGLTGGHGDSPPDARGRDTPPDPGTHLRSGPNHLFLLLRISRGTAEKQRHGRGRGRRRALGRRSVRFGWIREGSSIGTDQPGPRSVPRTRTMSSRRDGIGFGIGDGRLREEEARSGGRKRRGSVASVGRSGEEGGRCRTDMPGHRRGGGVRRPPTDHRVRDLRRWRSDPPSRREGHGGGGQREEGSHGRVDAPSGDEATGRDYGGRRRRRRRCEPVPLRRAAGTAGGRPSAAGDGGGGRG
mmetsp:Transcript_25100/g.73512  ORF Transcript_25100/g.73512 Transcript_25100/m.73512 type:complete len:262 (+) Transcript_25100:84-869(+)